MTPLMKPMFDPRRWPRKAGFWAGVIAGAVSVILLVWIVAALPRLWSGGRVWFVPPYLFMAAALPRLWSGVRVWLVTPYLLIAVHLMIVVIWKLSKHKARANHRLEDEKPPPQEVPVADKPRAVAGELLPVADPVEFEAATPVTVPKSGGSVPEPSSSSSVASCLATESDAMSTASSRVEIKKSVEVPMPSVESPAEEDDDESLEARWTAIKAADTASVVRSPSPEAEAAPLPANGSDPSESSCLATESDAMSTASSRVEIKKSVEVPMPSVESLAEEDDDESLEARWTAIKAADTASVVRSPPPVAEAAPLPAKGSEPGPEEMNRRYDAFIQKNYDQRADPVAAVHEHG